MNAEIPGAIVVEAHAVNYWRPDGHGGVPNKPRALFLHTPEEPADNVESTPAYFAQEHFNEDGSRRLASTHYYVDSDGDLYQMVPENCAAIANGLDGKPLPAWALPGTSLNWQSLSWEIEGYAATIHETCRRGGKQWNTIVRNVESRTRKYQIPLDRAHVMGHYEVSTSRTDPGRLNINAIVADAMDLRNQEDDDMPTEQQIALWNQAALDAKVALIRIDEIKKTMNARHLETAVRLGFSDAEIAKLKAEDKELDARLDAASAQLAGT